MTDNGVKKVTEVKYIVEGGYKLSGEVQIGGNKNAALPIIAACLLTDQPVTLKNIPRIRDTEVLAEIVRSMGADVSWIEQNTLRIEAKKIDPTKIDSELCGKVRASILLIGPIVARCGSIELPPPGGDVIGRRRVDTHLLGLEQLGAVFEVGETYKISAQKLVGSTLFLDEPSVTGTENILCAATRAEGKTEIHNAASEPHVQDLANFLVSLGAEIDGIGTNTLTVNGTNNLGSTEYTICSDHIEVASMIGLAAVTKSNITLKNAGVKHLRSILLNFGKLGIECSILGDDLTIPEDQKLKIIDDIGGHIPKIEDQPWPSFPADAMSIAIVTATQCEGVILLFEKMFESRMFFVDKLISMGARIVMCDPHRVIVNGPSQLRATKVASPDIRAGMALLIAAMGARGTTTINNAQQIERGYERLDIRLNAIGAKITRIEL